MPRTVEHIVASHQVAAERRAKGQRTWDRKFVVSDIFHNDDLPIEDKVSEIARRIRTQIQPRFRDDDELEMIVDEMEWTVEQFTHGKPVREGGLPEHKRQQITDEFDCVWDGFYDWCDLVGRVWVET